MTGKRIGSALDDANAIIAASASSSREVVIGRLEALAGLMTTAAEQALDDYHAGTLDLTQALAFSNMIHAVAKVVDTVRSLHGL